ncbi:MAG: carboxypeptidase-like regulatory domain-containing protein, partial [Tannerellaceae bacterium]
MRKEKNPQSRIVFFRHLSTILMGAMIPISVVAIDGSIDTINETFKSQQSVIRVKGKVVDENGEPLPGANIQVEKSTRGVMTDLDGTFDIDVKGS